jgi:fumarate hydratase subunit beta
MPQLRSGQQVLLSGTVYTARDAAHKRIVSILRGESSEALPFQLDGAVIYYAGPTPTKPGMVIGSCGPTTSSRMDPYTPLLLEQGLAGIIGKGERSQAVVTALQEHQAVYFCAVGGAGALAARHIIACEEIAFQDLGCESVKQLKFKDFPLFVGIDAFGGSLFEKTNE